MSSPGLQLAELVHEIFALEAVVIFDADLHEIYQAGYWNVDPQELAQNVYYFESSDDDPETGISRRVLRLGNVPIGSIVIRGDTSPLTNNAIASLIAVTFDRYRAFANESRIETERQTEQLRATVLDSLAHEYKTPLTAIRAASTGLSRWASSRRAGDLVSLINEQTDLLNELTTKLLTTARLDADEVTVHAVPVGVASLIDEVVARMSERLASDEGRDRHARRQAGALLRSPPDDDAAVRNTSTTPANMRSTARRLRFAPCSRRAKSSSRFTALVRSFQWPTASGSSIATIVRQLHPIAPRVPGIGLSVAKRAATDPRRLCLGHQRPG